MSDRDCLRLSVMPAKARASSPISSLEVEVIGCSRLSGAHHRHGAGQLV